MQKNDSSESPREERGAVTRYKKDGKEEKVKASVIIADKTASLQALGYDLTNLEMMPIHSVVQIQDFIPKKELVLTFKKDQRTNGPVNAHLISWPRISI